MTSRLSNMRQPETPPLTVAALARWLRYTQDRDDEYIYQDPAKCLLGRYFEDLGAADVISESAYEQFPDYRAIAEPKPHTFGAALERAEKLLTLPAPAPQLEDHREPASVDLRLSQSD